MAQEKLAFWVTIMALSKGPSETFGVIALSSIPPVVSRGTCGLFKSDGFKGRRWSCLASEFKKFWILSKQAIEAFNIGMVLIIVFIGPASKEIKDSPVNAAEVSKILPEYFAIRTKTMNVTSGARDVVLLARREVNIGSFWQATWGLQYLETRESILIFETELKGSVL